MRVLAAVGWICVGWMACFLSGIAASKGIWLRPPRWLRRLLSIDYYDDVLDPQDLRRHN